MNSTNGEKGLLMKLRRLGPMETHLGTSGTTSDAEDSQAENQTLRGTHYHDLPHYFPQQKILGPAMELGARGCSRGAVRCASGLAMCAMARRCKRWARLVDSLLATETDVATPSFRGLKKDVDQ